MGTVSKGNIIFAKKTDKESSSCEFINMCYRIVLLTQTERCNWISEDSDNEKITLDILPIKKAQFRYQTDHNKIYQITENLWKSTIFGGFAFYLLPQIGAIYCNIQCARREQDFS